MGLLAQLVELLGYGNARRVRQLALAIAHRSQAAVWQRVVFRSPAMSPHEARGYIRARAALVIHTQVDRAIAVEDALPARYRDEVIELATGEVLRLIVRQWLQSRSEPAVLRRAA